MRRLAARGVALEVRHQVGTGSLESTRSAYARLRIEASVTHFIEDMAGAYAWADFAVACGGAATLAELAAAALPALLVPLSWAALDHQTANVRAFAEETGTLWTREADWDAERHASDLARLATSPDAWRAAVTAMRRASRPRAAQDVVPRRRRPFRRAPRPPSSPRGHHPLALPYRDLPTGVGRGRTAAAAGASRRPHDPASGRWERGGGLGAGGAAGTG
jgi:UDP-N-acetylglucosamine--N-acetylmuramyl-(pentapeptide) pyrophosphoryl-undecaprenol N-acetylglucosamine transferase